MSMSANKSQKPHEGGKILSGIKSGFKKASHEASDIEHKITKGASSLKNDFVKEAKKIPGGLSKAKEEIITDLQKVPGEISQAGHYVESGVLEIGDTFSKLEDDLLPSSNKILTETGLIILGVVAASVVLFKVL